MNLCKYTVKLGLVETPRMLLATKMLVYYETKLLVIANDISVSLIFLTYFFQ